MKTLSTVLSLIAISSSGISSAALASENQTPPAYLMKWQEAQVKISDLASQCEKKPQITVSQTGGSQDRIIRARCNIMLPIDQIQAIDKFPHKIVMDGTTLELNYSANRGVFPHTLHVTLTAMNGYRSSLVPGKERGIVFVVPNVSNVDERLDIEDKVIAAISAETKRVLSRSQDIIFGKKLMNPMVVSVDGRTKILLPVESDVFLETIRKHPRSFGLDYPENFDE